MKLVKKISRATVVGDAGSILEKCIGDKTKTFPLYRVFGYCNGSREGESDYGSWRAMLGSFQAINTETGEVFHSPVAFLPQFAADTVLGQLGGDVTRVAFAFDIGARWDETSDRPNYTYTAEPLLEPAADDPLAILFNKVSELKALPGPAKGARKALAGKPASE